MNQNGGQIRGRIHSVESFGAVDGPGIRFVVFLQGCPLRCKFCHNPDSWDVNGGTETTAQQMAEQIEGYHSFIKKGGVTLSGGEPLFQPEFCAALLKLCHENGLHTCIDTSGGVPLEKALPALEQADLLLLDIKDIDPDGCKALTGRTNENAEAILAYCEEQQKPVWIRHVLVPGLTLDDGKLERMAAYLSGFRCVERVELLPFHKMGEYKWENLQIPYTLADVQPPTAEELEHAKSFFSKRGIPVY